MKNRMLKLTGGLLLSSTLVLTATGLAQQPVKPWTVAVYLHADHNLDPSAIADLEEMGAASGGNLKNVRVVYYLDRNDDAEDAGPGVEMGIIENGERQVVRTLPEQNSDDPKVLTDFVTWAYKTYPSQKRGLILWDHGGQWDGGFGKDEHGPGTGEDKPAMSLRDVAAAVQAGLRSLNVNQFEFLSFDTCLMGGAEVLSQFAPLTQLYIADAELDFGDGWDYANTLGFLDANPNVTMQAFGKAQVQFWDKHHLASGGEDDQNKRTNAAFDTTLWPATEVALSAFAVDLKTMLADPQQRAAILKARSETYDYGFDSDGDKPGTRTPYVDLGYFARRVSQLTTDARLKASSTALSAAIDKMTIAKSIGDKIPGASALSIYMPLKNKLPDDTNEMLLNYGKLELNADQAWLGFKSQWVSTLKGTAATLAFKDITVARKGQAYQIGFTPTGSYLDSILVNLYSINGNVTTDYGDLYYQAATAGQKTFTWTPALWTLSDGKTTTLLTADRDEPGSLLYSSTALYTPPGEEGFDIMIRFNESGRVVGVLDTSGIAPVGINLKAGGKLQFYTRTYKGSDVRPSETLVKSTLTVSSAGLGGLKAVRAPLPPGNYELAFSLFDQLGNDEGESVPLTD